MVVIYKRVPILTPRVKLINVCFGSMLKGEKCAKTYCVSLKCSVLLMCHG